MWKKQWSKLKTALASPEEYVEEEQEEQQETETEEVQLRSDPVIEISSEDLEQVLATATAINSFKRNVGDMTLRHEQERANALEINSQLNRQLGEQIDAVRTIYNVEPTVEYVLNFPTEKGGIGTLTREPDKD
jgi:hypothetical protein